MHMRSRTKELEELLEGIYAIKRHLFAGGPAVMQDFRITGSQWLGLSVIARKGNISIKDLAAELSITSSAATQIVGELIKGEYVIKRSDLKDARAASISISIKTKKALTSLRRVALTRMLKLFSVLDDSEFATYTKLQTKLVSHYKP